MLSEMIFERRNNSGNLRHRQLLQTWCLMPSGGARGRQTSGRALALLIGLGR